jgi:hypothetical protein
MTRLTDVAPARLILSGRLEPRELLLPCLPKLGTAANFRICEIGIVQIAVERIAANDLQCNGPGSKGNSFSWLYELGRGAAEPAFLLCRPSELLRRNPPI